MSSNECILDDVESLLKKLNDAESEVTRQTRQRNSLREDITTVKTAQNDRDQAVEAYSKALDSLTNVKKERKDYYETKWRMILCAVETSREDIDTAIRTYDDEIVEKRKKVKELIEQVNAASKAYEDATEEVNKKQGEFEVYKHYKANLDKTFNEINGLKVQIEKEDDLNHPASMYYLIGELKKILDEANVISPDELRNKIDDKWCELYAAKKGVRDKKADWDDNKAELTDGQKTLNDLEQKRSENILGLISKYNHTPEPCAPKTPEHTTSDKAQHSY